MMRASIVIGLFGARAWAFAPTPVARPTSGLRASATADEKAVFPFTAVVGHDEMKLCLELNVVDPKIGGVLIMGDRGTGKSTAIRALTTLLPEISVFEDDPFNSDPNDPAAMGPDALANYNAGTPLAVTSVPVPMIDLPLGATEDRVCGTIDMERALNEGSKSFQPGLLAKANRGILYVDEVNLLEDHLTDVLLDSAASGVNTVEREGVSIRHPAKFVLIGSGNPEEGDLRPQLLDRFGMYAEINTIKDPLQRAQILEYRTKYSKDAVALRESFAEQESELKARLAAAKALLPSVVVPRALQIKIAEVCADLGVDGLRGDIVVNRCAKAFAATQGRAEVVVADVQQVVKSCLAHRMRKDVLDSVDAGEVVTETFLRIFKAELAAAGP